MPTTELDKWLGWADPLGIGVFDVANEAAWADRHMDAWSNFLWLGWFTTRILGGYNLRKRTDHTVPTKADPIIGTADGEAATIDTGFLCEKTFGVDYVFGLSAVGGLGEEGDIAALAEVVFPPALPIEGTLPNPPTNVRVTGLGNDEFRVDWQYNARGELAAPTYFRIFYDAGTGTIDESASIADVEYVSGQVNYSHVLTGLSGLPGGKYRANFLVRSALDLAGTHERNVNVASAANAAAAVEGVVTVLGKSDGLHLPRRVR